MRVVPHEAALRGAARNPVILLGETHDDAAVHRWQLHVAAGLLARNANARGLNRKPWVKTSLAPGSKAVELYLQESGLLPELESLGFGIVGFACTTCNGMSGALDPAIQQEIIDRDLYDTAVLSGNRNFEGRQGPGGRTHLVSPLVAAATAVTGHLASPADL